VIKKVRRAGLLVHGQNQRSAASMERARAGHPDAPLPTSFVQSALVVEAGPGTPATVTIAHPMRRHFHSPLLRAAVWRWSGIVVHASGFPVASISTSASDAGSAAGAYGLTAPSGTSLAGHALPCPSHRRCSSSCSQHWFSAGVAPQPSDVLVWCQGRQPLKELEGGFRDAAKLHVETAPLAVSR